MTKLNQEFLRFEVIVNLKCLNRNFTLTQSIKFLLTLTTICFCHLIVIGQQYKVDSLLLQFPKSLEDTNKVNLLYNLSYEYWDINPNEGLKYAKDALLLSEKLETKNGIAESYSNISRSYRRLTNLTKSLEYGFKSLELFEDMGDKYGIVRNFINIGNTYRVQKDFNKSLEYLQKTLKIK